LHPVEKGFEIELIGEIAAMVDLGAQNKTAGPKGSAVPDAYRRSVKMVAGGPQPPIPNSGSVAVREGNRRQLTLPPIAV
jgi:hypothetical protein